MSFGLRTDSPALALENEQLTPIADWLAVRKEWIAYKESNFKLLLEDANYAKLQMVSHFKELEELICKSTELAQRSFLGQLDSAKYLQPDNERTAWLTEEENKCLDQICDMDIPSLVLNETVLTGGEFRSYLLQKMRIRIAIMTDSVVDDEESDEEIHNGDLIESDIEMETD